MRGSKGPPAFGDALIGGGRRTRSRWVIIVSVRGDIAYESMYLLIPKLMGNMENDGGGGGPQGKRRRGQRAVSLRRTSQRWWSLKGREGGVEARREFLLVCRILFFTDLVHNLTARRSKNTCKGDPRPETFAQT